MNSKEVTAEYRMSYWAQILKDRSESGKNIRDYCKATGIVEHTYHYWQRRLRSVVCQELAPAPEAEGNPISAIAPQRIDAIANQSQAFTNGKSNLRRGDMTELREVRAIQSPPGWAVCKTEETTPQKAALSIEIGKFKMRVDTDTDEELLAKTCRLLMTLC